MASRPSGRNLWAGKPAGVVSVTPYKMGAFGANHAIRQSLVFLDMPAMQQPEAYIGSAGDLFDDRGSLTNNQTRQFLANFMASFERWVATIHSGVSNNELDAFMKQREKVAAAYSSGDASLLGAIVAREGTATFLPPTGGFVSGADVVAARYDTDAKSFSPGNKTSLEVLELGASGGLAFWSGFQNFEGKIGGKEMTIRLRVTELFRLTDGTWRLYHRHADPLAAPQSRQSLFRRPSR